MGIEVVIEYEVEFVHPNTGGLPDTLSKTTSSGSQVIEVNGAKYGRLRQ